MRAVGVSAPLVVDLVVDRHERGLPTDSEPDIAGGQPLVHTAGDVLNGCPRFVGIGERDPRIFVNAGDGVGEFQRRLARLDAAGDRSRARRARCGGKRDVTLTGEQTRRRVQSDPAGAGDVHLGPGVQVGEIRGRP